MKKILEAILAINLAVLSCIVLFICLVNIYWRDCGFYG